MQISGRKSSSLAAAISAILAAGPAAQAQESNKTFDEVIVTATRRSESVQDVPLNIAAVGGDLIQERGITNLVDISRSVPGLFVIDQGPRGANAIVVRGLNANPVSGTEALNNTGGGTVATYIGEIPLYVDLKLSDVERVEVLLGPQGTLYGAGTLGGAVRYIPRRPQFSGTTLELRGDAYGLSQSDGIGADAGFTFNIPIGENLAFRASVDYLDDPGFIDYNFLVRESGVSDPEPDFSNPADVEANLRKEEDANYQKTLSGRAALRWQITDAIDANLTYYYQNQEVGGRTINQMVSFNTGQYESAQRYLEPQDRKNQLAALEVTADLGFAELTSATGYAMYDEGGQRDQTDLLIALEYGYEAFPSFSAFTREEQEDRSFNQEFRLVSSSDGLVSWIAGAFYNQLKSNNFSKEFTPHYDEFIGTVRPDSLEYMTTEDSDLEEMAVYGELSFQFTDAWQVTVGGRWYEYEVETVAGSDTPLFDTSEGAGPYDLSPDYSYSNQKDSGSLFKFNASYKFTPDVMSYLTISQGYRIGNSNDIVACEDPLPPGQNLCALPNEMEYFPDKTLNYEIGLHSRLFDRMTFNAALFFIKWSDPQVASTTINGFLPIVFNANSAESKGGEVSFDLELTDRLSLQGSYAYAHAVLTSDAPARLNTIVPPGFSGTTQSVDAKDGDRLPGSPEHQGSLHLIYSTAVSGDLTLHFDYGVTAISSILTKVGSRAGGEELGGFALHSLSVALKADSTWSAMLYAENLFDRYAETGVRATNLYAQTVFNANGDPVTVRSYSRDVVRPRQIGLRVNYKFDF
jgi:iron complex outermembrane receptor protein